MATYQNRIMARSPYYITATGAAYITSATLDIYVWHGDNTAKPASPTYSLAKDALTATSTNIVFEISALIRDSFHHVSEVVSAPSGGVIDCLWVETELDVVQTTAPNPATVNNLYLAFDGFSYYEQDVNWSGGFEALEKTITVNSGDDIRIGVYCSDDDGYNEVTFKSPSGAQITQHDLTTEAASISSYDKVKYINQLYSLGEVGEISIASSTIVIGDIDIDVSYNEQCKYEQRVLKFINKVGILEELAMASKSVKAMRVTRDKYNAIITDVVSNQYIYNLNHHQNKTYNVNASESETLNSGWVHEDMNEQFKQLLLSEYVWLDDVPVNVDTNSLTYKTKTNDRLINYTINVEYAKDVINNV